MFGGRVPTVPCSAQPLCHGICMCFCVYAQVGIVTAAGYPGEAEKFERRLSGLLETFRALRVPAEITDR